ncbi:uncharacterized protein LOC114353857 [Ostrinia furnacalis]|uniref:uncharacterized protein LOC114353857 n=1 Tax=Ostrinia furnacalis TaxID=93504 RepID=UPI00103FF7D2|nr:uncharacterized protein LOC114353857 [Ostrinia furnacalis]
MRSIFIFLLAFQCANADKDIIPVFLMDYGGVMSHLTVEANPFSKISTAYFADIIHDAIKRSEVVIIFVEDQFSVEDITIKDKLGTPYHHLHQDMLENKVKFFPGVIEPFKLLNQIFQPQQFNVFYLNSGTKLQMFDGHFKYFYIFFQDGKNETRAEVLRRHDLIMREVYFVVRQLAPGAVVAFYTGKMNPVEVEKIEFVPISPIAVTRDPGVMVVTDGALFRFVGVYAATQTRRATFNQIPMVAEETWTLESLSTKMAYTDFELEFNFSFKDKGWLLENVALLEGGEEVGRTDMGVGARWNWAYYCGEPLVLVNTRDGSSVTISEYQIQPLKKRNIQRSGTEDITTTEDPDAGSGSGAGSDDNKGFGSSVNCGPYYSASILAGLFISGICFGILIFGVTIMYDCQNNDRYDDAQGKPLVITFEGGGH